MQTFEETVPSQDIRLGAVYNPADKSCSFSLWAPAAYDVSVQLYRSACDMESAFTIPLKYDTATGVWQGDFTAADELPRFYAYTIRSECGIHTVPDPYSMSMAAYTGDNSMGRSYLINLQDKALKPECEYPYIPLTKREDAIIYEVSVRDFTSSTDSGVQAAFGTYKAFIEKIPYLQELGITHVQLMPVLQFYYTDETNRRYEDAGTVHNNNYNWGYDPYNYFTPEGWYASDPCDPECRVRELRELINECHKAGIGVLLDVVYNHVAKTDIFEHIVPGYYFRTHTDGSYTNGSGCGNDLASERFMVKKLIVDSTVHWVSEYKADGFRFDLMGLLDTETVLEAYKQCRKHNPSVLFIGEGWQMYNGADGTVGMDQQYMTKTDSVAVFNDEFRDLVKAGGINEEGKGFLTGGAVSVRELFYNCLGCPQQKYRTDSPGDNVQYLVCHDGLTLHDCIAHNTGLDERNPTQKKELIARLKIGNVLVLTSQGIAFLHAGQERGRTKPNISRETQECVGAFVRNSYDASDSINRIVWALDDEYAELLAYTRGFIALRKRFTVFRIGDAARITQAAQFLPANCIDDPAGVGTEPYAENAFGYTLNWTDGTWFLLFNAAGVRVCFTPEYAVKNPVVFADSVQVSEYGIEYPDGIYFDHNRIVLDPYAAAVFRA